MCAAVVPGAGHLLPEAELTELRRRIRGARWPEQELVGDASRGVQLNTMQKVAQYCAEVYDWRKVEARLNVFRSSSMRSTALTFISFTFTRNMTTRYRGHRHTRVARLNHRAAKDHRSAY